MANKIARGTTGQAQYDYSEPISNGFPNQYEGYWDFYNEIERDHNPQGHNVTSEGMVTIPIDSVMDGPNSTFIIVKYGPGFDSAHFNGQVHHYSFEVVCVAVTVNITKLSSAKIPGSSPVQYAHKYAVEAKVSGGTKPYSYSWSASSGSLSASGDSGILTFTNSNPTAAGISATVTCTVSDSGTCSDTDTASIVDGKPAIEGGGPCVGPGNSQKRCTAGGICIQSTGNNPVPSGGSNPQQYGHYGSHGS